MGPGASLSTLKSQDGASNSNLQWFWQALRSLKAPGCARAAHRQQGSLGDTGGKNQGCATPQQEEKGQISNSLAKKHSESGRTYLEESSSPPDGPWWRVDPVFS